MSDDPAPPGWPVDLPWPPHLPEAFGYPGSARFVAIHWSPAGDVVLFEDGRRSGARSPFVVYRRHPAVAPLLHGCNLGSSDAQAEHCLLLDRQHQRADVAPLAQGQAFLQGQHPPPPLPTPQQAEVLRRQILAGLTEGWRQVQVDPQGLHRTVEAQRQRLGRMRSWLDQCPALPHQGRGHDGR